MLGNTIAQVPTDLGDEASVKRFLQLLIDHLSIAKADISAIEPLLIKLSVKIGAVTELKADVETNTDDIEVLKTDVETNAIDIELIEAELIELKAADETSDELTYLSELVPILADDVNAHNIRLRTLEDKALFAASARGVLFEELSALTDRVKALET